MGSLIENFMCACLYIYIYIYDIYNPYSDFYIVYIDNVLIFSNSIEQHFKHLKTFYLATRKAGLAISSSKVSLFQTKVRFLGHHISKGMTNESDFCLK